MQIIVQTAPSVHLPVQLSRHWALHCDTFVHSTLQPGKVPQMTSQLAPPTHEHVESWHVHVAPVHVGCAVGAHAAITTIANATEAVTARARMTALHSIRTGAFLLASSRMAREPAKLKEASLSIDFGIFKLDSKWMPDARQREAAWALWVELSTRVATQPVELDEGLVREALASLHELFGATRHALRTCGPDSGAKEGSVGAVALLVLNGAVRPFLSRWHPLLAAWEEERPEGRSARDHERAWQLEGKCRGELEKLRRGLVTYAETLAALAS